MFNRMFPELHVADCEAAAQFFEKALGYHRGYTLLERGQLDFAVMEHPDPGLQLTLHRMLPATEAAKPRYIRLYFEPQDIDALCSRLRASGFDVAAGHTVGSHTWSHADLSKKTVEEGKDGEHPYQVEPEFFTLEHAYQLARRHRDETVQVALGGIAEDGRQRAGDAAPVGCRWRHGSADGDDRRGRTSDRICLRWGHPGERHGQRP